MKEGFPENPQLPSKGVEERFDPEQELREIRTQTPAGRAEKLPLWKEKYAEQRLALARLQADLIQRVRKAPESTGQELLTMLDEADAKYHFGSEQRQLAESIIAVYEERHEVLKKVREQYPKNTEFVKAVFGISPIGRVTVEQGPVTFNLKCNNGIDFERMHHFDEKGYAVLRALIRRIAGSSRTGGVTFGEVLLPELAGMVTVQDTSVNLRASGNVMVHEEQHAFRHLLQEAGWRIQPEREVENAGASLNKRNKKMLLRECRNIIEDSLENEILAHLKGRATWSKTSQSIGFYLSEKYLVSAKENLVQEMLKIEKEMEEGSLSGTEGGEATHLLADVIKEVASPEFSQEMLSKAERAISAYMHFRDVLEMKDEEITSLLAYEPLGQWPKLADRLSAEKAGVEKTSRR